MTDATIFGNEGDNQKATPAAATTDASLFQSLVGETQKYKTPEDLAKAYANADQFIETLKEENRKLREQVTQAKTIDEVLERMSKQGSTQEDDNPPAPGITPDVVQQLVEKTLEGRKQQETRTANLLKADQMMKEKFGEKAAEVFKQRASSQQKAQVLMELAATDPNEFVSLFVGSPQVNANNFDAGSMNTTSVASNSGIELIQSGLKSGLLKFAKKTPTLLVARLPI
jgi:hypothetical protein